ISPTRIINTKNQTIHITLCRLLSLPNCSATSYNGANQLGGGCTGTNILPSPALILQGRGENELQEKRDPPQTEEMEPGPACRRAQGLPRNLRGKINGGTKA
ncbi:hypothetical protein KI387_042935, partial [Taxus chinensis]